MESATHYAIIQAKVEREHDLIHHRISWLVAGEAFLFGAFAISSSATPVPNGTTRQYQVAFERLHSVIPILGILLSTLVQIGVLAAICVIVDFQKHRTLYISGFDDQHPERITEKRGISTLPRIAGPFWTQVLGLVPPILVPALFLACWIFVVL